ncbi:MAG: ABC transporter ATP-binding protein [bacterium]|nr:ABC transporter ATP-binding protein [bacterium]
MKLPAVSVNGVGVTFRSYVEQVPTMRRMVARGRLRRSTSVVALDDVSFDVDRGETFGLVGDNGAGKSTLLRVIARTMRPDNGTVTVRGETSTLLQLGAGFNLELSGRRNVYLSGLAHGLRRAEITRLFDDIVDYAGLAEAIDRPLKSYSSGMLSRLAFSISMHLLPDILLLDEVLAVGDAGFREKSLGAMRDLLVRGGTVIVASHSLQMVVEMCDRVLWLERGKIRGLGPAAPVIEAYRRAPPVAAG